MFLLPNSWRGENTILYDENTNCFYAEHFGEAQRI